MKSGRKTMYAAKTKEMPWYITWRQVHTRCNNPKSGKSNKRYYNKGIKLKMLPLDFAFLWARDRAWEMKKHSIDRINPRGNYTLDNCRYIELRDNIRRKSNSKLTLEDARSIRSLYKCGRGVNIAHLFSISPRLVQMIVKNQRWIDDNKA